MVAGANPPKMFPPKFECGPGPGHGHGTRDMRANLSDCGVVCCGCLGQLVRITRLIITNSSTDGGCGDVATFESGWALVGSEDRTALMQLFSESRPVRGRFVGPRPVLQVPRRSSGQRTEMSAPQTSLMVEFLLPMDTRYSYRQHSMDTVVVAQPE